MEYAHIAPMMGQLWAPIAAVTSRRGDVVNAQICVAISASSIVPSMPRVSVQIYKRNFSHELIYQTGAFALNFLRKDQLEPIRDFGLVSGRETDKLAEVPYETKSSGCPILADCWGYLDCRVINAMDGGDMTCFLAEVLEGDILCESEPLWWGYAKRVVPADWMEEWDRKVKEEIAFSTERMGHIDLTPWKAPI